MAKTSLATVKEHLRVEVLDTSQDNVLSIYTEAAEEHMEKWCDRQFPTPLPFGVTASVLLFVGELYENRESLNVGNISTPLPAMDRLLQPFRNYEGYFGSVSLPPAVAGLDDQEIIRGDDWSRVFRWKDSAGVPINITGHTGTFDLMCGETVIVSGSLTIGIPASGEFSYTIQDSITAGLTSGEYWYRARVLSSGEVTTLVRKRVMVI